MPHTSLQHQRSPLVLQLLVLLAAGGGGGNVGEPGASFSVSSSYPSCSSGAFSFGPRIAAAAVVDDNPLYITTATTKDGKECSVGPYGRGQTNLPATSLERADVSGRPHVLSQRARQHGCGWDMPTVTPPRRGTRGGGAGRVEQGRGSTRLRPTHYPSLVEFNGSL